MANIHVHCDNCYQNSCNFKECLLVDCQLCHVPLHTCKLKEHLADICRRAQVACPNSGNGCKLLLIREKIPHHLPKCVASVVVCSRDRCRKLNAKPCKIQLKHMGRQSQFVTTDSDHLDVNLAVFDQNLIIESYHSSRPKRVRQRDPVHPAHPLIPLRNMPFDTTSPTEGFDDSSEDEMREKREKLKKSRMVFANCYMCQIDPSVQHLHTLGNGMDIEKIRKRRMTPHVNDVFHDQLNLKVSIAVENAPESVLKSENIREIKKGGTLYTLKCLKTVRRAEYGDHCLSQHTQSVDQLNEMILRCPNWSSGCGFTASRIKLKCGELKFLPHSSTISHEIPTNTLSVIGSSNLSLDNLPLWVYELLGAFLPSSSLYNLSQTNKKLREIVFLGCNSHCFVEPVWKKTDVNGKWEQNGFIWKVSSTEPPPKLEWTVPVELSQHLSKCSYFDPVTYEEKMIPIFPRDLESEIWKGFENELSERLIRNEILALQEDP
ncbi:unnamed protein product [Caenorhabditis sp. 36 PRJEB53466]|nr:unnamed protein product [Caenorhabditis sp. 36 PRJEB53466]